jgi:hypothetical protein
MVGVPTIGGHSMGGGAGAGAAVSTCWPDGVLILKPFEIIVAAERVDRPQHCGLIDAIGGSSTGIVVAPPPSNPENHGSTSGRTAAA